MLKYLLGIFLSLIGSYLPYGYAETPKIPLPQTPLKVLFVGNSYTYYNQMPSIVAALASAAEKSRPIQPHELTIPGARALQVFSLPQIPHLLASEKWDYVVLQVMPYKWRDDPEDVSTHIEKMSDAIKASGAKPIIYLTWGGNVKKPDELVLNPSVYVDLTKKIGGLFAPVGKAWLLAKTAAPKLLLYNVDGHHPAKTGSVLAACVIFRVIHNNQLTCEALDNVELSKEEFALLNQFASAAIENPLRIP